MSEEEDRKQSRTMVMSAESGILMYQNKVDMD